MTNVKLLDCTLRDGGYYTNWDFNKETTKKYLKCINDLPIEYIEVGYMSNAKNHYLGEFFYLPLSTLRYVKKLTFKKVAVMLNAKDCENIDLATLFKGSQDLISLVRVATDPDKVELSIRLARDLKCLGFDVALNIMYISKIDKNHNIFDCLDNMKGIVKYLYLVDSYGSILPGEFEKLIRRMQSRTNIELGFHGHNNLELAFANTLKAIECGVQIIDCTVLGMGRGAGNLKTELILTYLKSNFNVAVNINTLGNLTESFQSLLCTYNWGTNLAYMVSGLYSLPQRYIMEALDINRYSLSGIVSQLQNDGVTNFPLFKPEAKYRDCIIIGGGDSVRQHIVAINEYLLKNTSTLIIHSTSKNIELFEKIKNVQYLSVAGDEILKVNKDIKFISKYILEPSPRKINTNIINRKDFHELKSIRFVNNYFDSPFSISLQTALDSNIETIYLAGFDGYSGLKNTKELYLMIENQKIINNFITVKKLISLTKSTYENLRQKSIYSMLN